MDVSPHQWSTNYICTRTLYCFLNTRFFCNSLADVALQRLSRCAVERLVYFSHNAVYFPSVSLQRRCIFEYALDSFEFQVLFVSSFISPLRTTAFESDSVWVVNPRQPAWRERLAFSCKIMQTLQRAFFSPLYTVWIDSIPLTFFLVDMVRYTMLLIDLFGMTNFSTPP